MKNNGYTIDLGAVLSRHLQTRSHEYCHVQAWAALMKNSGNTIDVGAVLESSSTNLLPQGAYINGIACSLQTS